MERKNRNVVHIINNKEKRIEGFGRPGETRSNSRATAKRINSFKAKTKQHDDGSHYFPKKSEIPIHTLTYNRAVKYLRNVRNSYS